MTNPAPRTGAWDQGQDDRLTELWAAGYKVLQISAMMGRTFDSIRRRRLRLELPSRRPGPRAAGDRALIPPAQPMTPEEERAAVAAFIAWHGVTQCPHAYSAPVNGANEIDRILPALGTYHGDWKAQRDAFFADRLTVERIKDGQETQERPEDRA